MIDFLFAALKVIVFPLLVLNLVPVSAWFERKASAYMQDRRGPNRAHILGIRLGGMIHNLADVLKLLTKEEFVPAGANRFYYFLAPLLILFVYFITVAVIPFADDVALGGHSFSLSVAPLNVGVLYIFSVTSLAVYGIMLGGWSSNNKYSMLGGLRASSQMISYEITLGLSVVSLFMLSGSVDLNEIVRGQAGSPLSWYGFRQPLAFLLFLAAAFAETNRTPFDLPEGESELVAGYHTEYSGMRFGLFMMAEYAALVVSSAVIVSLFFGGWQVPFLSTEALIAGAPFFLGILGFALSILSVLLGLLLLTKFRRGRLGDLRDYEVLIFGIPAILIGGGLGGFLYSQGVPMLADWAPPLFAAAVQLVCFLGKVLFFCFFFVWVRWTLPRFRYDQLMRFGWKGLLPLSLFNILVTGALLLWS